MAKLYFRYGAMNSGKSTALMQVAYNYEERGMRVLIMKPRCGRIWTRWRWCARILQKTGLLPAF